MKKQPMLSSDATVKPLFWDTAIARASKYLGPLANQYAEDIVQQTYSEIIGKARSRHPANDFSEQDVKLMFWVLKRRCIDAAYDHRSQCKNKGSLALHQLRTKVRAHYLPVNAILERLDVVARQSKKLTRPMWIESIEDVQAALYLCAEIMHGEERLYGR